MNEINRVISNFEVLVILNALIKRYNTLSTAVTWKGSVNTYSELLAIQNPEIGDMYNVVNADSTNQIAAGSNFVWNGTVWDNLGTTMAGFVQKINSLVPDSSGNVQFPYIKSITADEDTGRLTIITSYNGVDTTEVVPTGRVKTVNTIEADEVGNVDLVATEEDILEVLDGIDIDDEGKVSIYLEEVQSVVEDYTCIIAGDTIIIDYYGGGTLTNANKNLHLSIPINKIIKAASFTMIVQILAVRQDGTYLMNTQSGSPIVEYTTVNRITNTGLLVTFTADDSWNGTNNSIVSIQFQASITFN